MRKPLKPAKPGKKPTAKPQQDSLAMTSETLSTGSSPTTAGDVGLTIITSGGTGGPEIIKLLDLPGPLAIDPSVTPPRIGDRHIFWFKTQTDPNDVIKVKRYDVTGDSEQASAVLDRAGTQISSAENGDVLLMWEGSFAVFEFNGIRWCLDHTAPSDSVMLPQGSYVPSPIGHADGKVLTIVGGVPTWATP